MYEITNPKINKTTNIIKELDLKHVKYADTTMYSHFGKDNLSREQIID